MIIKIRKDAFTALSQQKLPIITKIAIATMILFTTQGWLKPRKDRIHLNDVKNRVKNELCVVATIFCAQHLAFMRYCNFLCAGNWGGQLSAISGQQSAVSGQQSAGSNQRAAISFQATVHASRITGAQLPLSSSNKH